MPESKTKTEDNNTTDVFDVTIMFKDGSGIKISNATNYSLADGQQTLKIAKNGYHTFVNFNEVMYVGKTTDLN